MGVFISPIIYQNKISALMEYLEYIRVYLDDLLLITLGSFEEHIANVEEVMKRLQFAEPKYKIDKRKFSVPRVEYLR